MLQVFIWVPVLAIELFLGVAYFIDQFFGGELEPLSPQPYPHDEPTQPATPIEPLPTAVTNPNRVRDMRPSVEIEPILSRESISVMLDELEHVTGATESEWYARRDEDAGEVFAIAWWGFRDALCELRHIGSLHCAGATVDEALTKLEDAIRDEIRRRRSGAVEQVPEVAA